MISWFKWAIFFHFVITRWFFTNQAALPSENGKASALYDAFVAVTISCWLVYKGVYGPFKNLFERIFYRHNTVHTAACRDGSKDFYEKCSFQCLKENFEQTNTEFKLYETMIARHGEMGIDFVTEEEIQKYISDHLKPRLWFLKKHIIRIAKLEPDFP